MNTHLKIGIFLLFFGLGQVTVAQTNQEKALTKGKEAIQLMDMGKYDESIKLLEEAQKLDPKDINYPYEIAYAYYLKKDYKKAIKIGESLLKHKDVNDRIYQLIGNTYDYLGDPEQAIKTYAAGLKVFPNSGNLYFESGVMKLKIRSTAKP